MNSKKICFIICKKENEKDDLAISYLENLKIPDGYEVDLLTNTFETSFLSCLDECMKATDALYKVVLRPNTCILFPEFLENVLEVFHMDEDIKIVAMQGFSKISREGLFWKGMDKSYPIEKDAMIDEFLDQDTKGYDEVQMFESSIFVIKEEVKLNSELFGGDIFWAESMAMETKRENKKIAVPRQKQPWCFSDTRYFSLEGYYETREIFMKEYEDVLQ